PSVDQAVVAGDTTVLRARAVLREAQPGQARVDDGVTARVRGREPGPIPLPGCAGGRRKLPAVAKIDESRSEVREQTPAAHPATSEEDTTPRASSSPVIDITVET